MSYDTELTEVGKKVGETNEKELVDHLATKLTKTELQRLCFLSQTSSLFHKLLSVKIGEFIASDPNSVNSEDRFYEDDAVRLVSEDFEVMDALGIPRPLASGEPSGKDAVKPPKGRLFKGLGRGRVRDF